MTAGIIRFWFFLLLTIISMSVSGIEENIRFRQLSPEGGFTFGAILTIEQDRKGVIWFGTKYGLYRYNSVDIKKYSYASNDSNSLIDNRINLVYKDSFDKLWITTEGGLCFYNERHDNFIAFPLYNSRKERVDENIVSLLNDAENNLWMLSNFGVGKIDLKNHSIDFVELEKNVSPNKLYLDENNNMWLTTTTGSFYWAQEPFDSFRLFAHIRNEVIYEIAIKDNTIWLGYEWEGVDCIGFDGALIKHFDSNKNDSLRLPNNYQIRSIYPDQSGRIWIGSWDGLALIGADGSNTTIPHNNFTDLRSNSIYKIFEDKDHGIWVGTWSGGLSYHNKYDNVFLHFKNSLAPNSLSDNVISSFAEDKNGDIWIGTERGGINKFDRKLNTFTTYELKSGERKIINIKSILVDPEGSVWAGTFRNGLWLKKKNEQHFQLFDHPEFNSEHIYSLKLNNNQLWIATYGKGLFRIDRVTGELKHFSNEPSDPSTLSENQVRNILIDSEGNLWVSTLSGLNFSNSGGEGFIRFFKEQNNPNSLYANHIFYCFEDSKRNVWIGTSGGGLSKVRADDFNFQTYTTDDGLAGNYVFGVEEDSKGNIWISTDQGLSRFTPESEEFRNYNAVDGIQGNQFNPGSVFKTSKGELLFGGSNGFTLFNPDNIKINPIKPNVFISEFKIKNADANIADYMTNNGNEKHNEIILNYNQNAFSFSFAADNYLLPQKNQYKYRLQNFNNKWSDADIPIAVYTNLNPGSYIFEVIAANNDGIWNDEPFVLKIKIRPPFYSSPVALITYFLILIGAVLITVKIIAERQKLKQEVALEKLQRKNDEELHNMKMRFFTNISHEFRTPLSLILMPLEKIINNNSLTVKQKHDLNVIRNNATRLLRLINQLLDLRVIENNKVSLKPKRLDVVKFCKEIYECYELQAKQKSIDFRFISNEKIIEADFDPEMMDKIVFNILSNAFKFTPEKGTITLTVAFNENIRGVVEYDYAFKVGEITGENFVEISVQDTGKGISKEEMPLIFDRFFHTDDKHYRGTGIGLALSKEYVQFHKGELLVWSEPGKGSQFSVRIPVRQEIMVIKNADESDTEKFVHVANKDFKPDEELKVKLKPSVKKYEHEKELLLIVEDNAELAHFIESVLEEDYKIITAENGKLGFEKAIKYLPDLIVSDIMMPEMDGLELSVAINHDARVSHIPIILLTALNSEEDQIKGLKTGVVDYLNKPFNENIFKTKIHNILESRRKLREKYAADRTEWEDGLDSLSTEKLFINRVQQAIEKNIDNSEFSVEDLADIVALSRSQLHRKLKNLTNQNATEFIRTHRLEKAVQLIKKGNHEIDTISYSVGFSSPSYFAKCFKEQFGITPTGFIHQFESGK